MDEYREPWELTEDQIHKAVIMGLEPEQVDEIIEQRKELYEEITERMYGDDPNIVDRHFYEKYGFEHICHCVDDEFMDLTVELPLCRVRLCDEALDHLEEVLTERDELKERLSKYE